MLENRIQICIAFKMLSKPLLAQVWLPFGLHFRSLCSHFASHIGLKIEDGSQAVSNSLSYQILVDFGGRRTLILVLPSRRQRDFHFFVLLSPRRFWDRF